MSTENTPGPSAGGAEGSRRLQENGRRGDGASSAFRDAFSLRGGTDGDPEGDPLEDLGAGEREEAVEARATWLPVIAVVLGIILALVLAIASYSAFQRAEQLQGWANSTYAVTGTYTDMTHDLHSESFNPKYAITLPDDEEISAQRFDSGLQDPFTPEPGQAVEVRGEGRGDSVDDFDGEVDVLLGVQDGELQVLSTAEAGSLDGGITDQTVSAQKTRGGLLAAASVLVLGLGIAGGVILRRRSLR